MPSYLCDDNITKPNRLETAYSKINKGKGTQPTMSANVKTISCYSGFGF